MAEATQRVEQGEHCVTTMPPRPIQPRRTRRGRVVLLVVILLLFNAFNSVKSAMLILVNVPFALIGGIVALLLTGIHLSVSAAIGFIALFGQAVLNGVVMVSYFNQL